MRWIGLCALVASFSAGCIEPPALRPRAPTPGVPYITVSTFNVELTRYNDEATIEAIGRTGADIVALQETSVGWQAVIAERYADLYPYQAFEGEASSGLAILSKFPFEDLGVVAGVDDWHPAWHVAVGSPIGRLQLLLVHLRPPYSVRGGVESVFTMDEAHLLEVQAFHDPCEEGTPTIILGDFNEGTDGVAIEYLEQRGFRNVLPLYRPGQETWRYPRGLYGQTVEALDHIMYESDALAPLNAWVRYDGNSDHLPVMAQFELRRPAP